MGWKVGQINLAKRMYGLFSRDIRLGFQFHPWRRFTDVDLETLEFLDLNRTACEHIFLGEHSPEDYNSLCTLDRDAIDYALANMLGYIKVITVRYYEHQIDALHKRMAEAAVIAEMEEAKARDAMAAVNASISKVATSLPKDNSTLKDTVIDIVEKHTSPTRGKHKPPYANKKRKNVEFTFDIEDDSKPPAKKANTQIAPKDNAKGKGQPGGKAYGKQTGKARGHGQNNHRANGTEPQQNSRQNKNRNKNRPQTNPTRGEKHKAKPHHGPRSSKKPHQKHTQRR